MALTTWPYNHHNHSSYSDGEGTLREHAEFALESGVEVLGLSDHAPMDGASEWCMMPSRLEAYRDEVLGLKREFGGRIEVALGLEVDWYPGHPEYLERVRAFSWDYLIGSTHYVETPEGRWPVDESAEATEAAVERLFAGSHRAACEAYFARHAEAAASGHFDVLGHLDLCKKFNRASCYFDEGEPWYRDAVEAVVEAAARTDTIVEVNTAGLAKAVGAFYPSPWILERCIHHGARVTLNSDSHSPRTVQYRFPQTLEALRVLGIRELWRWSKGAWGAVEI
jgi:histidinol-phosphatase (PHP family)